MVLVKKSASLSVLVLLLCLYVVRSSNNSTKMASNLQYEQFGEVLLASGNWKLITWVDYQDYFSFYEYLATRGDKLQAFCQQTSTQSCRGRCHTLQNRISRLQSEYKSMTAVLGIKSRVKRFWNNVGNYLSKATGGIKTIFATSPHHFIDSPTPINISVYDKELENLRNSKNELKNEPKQRWTLFQLDFKEKKSEWLENAKKEIKELEAQQDEASRQNDPTFTLIDTSLKNEAKYEEDRGKKFKRFHTLVDKFESDTVEYDTYVEQYGGIRQHPGCQFQFLKHFFRLLDLFDDEQSNLLEAIEEAKKGILNPYILSPVSLVLLLKYVQFDLPEGLGFPFYVTIENADKLARITKPSVNLYNSKVIFVLDVPLVESDRYTIHQIVNIPKSTDELGSNPPPFLVVDKGYKEYMFKSETDFRSACERIDERKYICKSIAEVSEYTDRRTHKSSNNNLTPLYYALVSGTVVLLVCAFGLIVYKKIASRKPHVKVKDPNASKFQIKFTLNKDNSIVRKLVLRGSPQINYNVKRQQTSEPPYETIH